MSNYDPLINPERIKPRVGISRCLLGEKVRYDGGHKLDRFLRDVLGKYVEWVPVCPEVEMGLSVPREPMKLFRVNHGIKLLTQKTRVNYTNLAWNWSDKKIKEIEKLNLSGYVFKSKSPSCGWRSVKVYDLNGNIVSYSGKGIFASRIMESFPLIPVEDEGRLNDQNLKDSFITRIFVFERLKHFMNSYYEPVDFIEFHTRMKLLIMAHSPKHLRTLGKMIAEANWKQKREFAYDYAVLLMEALRLKATGAKNRNVLEHILGYFKKMMSDIEKEQAREVIVEYYRGNIPLVVPLTILRNAAEKYETEYLMKQFYLSPYPYDLMLKNYS